MEFTPAFFLGGLKCIDFCNTFDHCHTPPAYDYFADRPAILQWGEAAGILSPGFHDSGANGESYRRALEARELIYKLLLPFINSSDPAEADLASFNTLMQESSKQSGIIASGDRFILVCKSADPLEKIVCEVTRSAADLLLSDKTSRLKQCAECGWLFYDSTRNRSRRWCDMKICGNKSKARRHYERIRQQKAAARHK